jgi:adenylate cyclase class IV
MARETEIKLRVADVAALRKLLHRLGARTVAAGSGRVHEWNTLYDTAAQDLRGRDQLLRVRVETATGSKSVGADSKKGKKRFVLTFKGPVEGGGSGAGSTKRSTRDRRFGGNHKVREEIELEIGDAKALGTIIARLGMRESFH